MNSNYRTHWIGDLKNAPLNEAVTIAGWVHKVRDLGGMVFLDIRDRSGHIQVTANQTTEPALLESAQRLRNEWVVQLTGILKNREADAINTQQPNGYLEIHLNQLETLSIADTPPILPSDPNEPDELTRLKYRYLDLRRPGKLDYLAIRHQVTMAIRNELDGHGFLEIETPVLTKSTPEGSRDFLVPCRMHPGQFFALPQSPQLFKQLLMMSGAERYFQIVKCFRDEDLRADRQPEFTQVDIEASFVAPKDIMKLTQTLLKSAFSKTGIEIPDPIPVMSYEDAVNRYGSDRPDLRFGLPITDISPWLKRSNFQVFQSVVAQDGTIRALRVPEGSVHLSRKKIDTFTETVKIFGVQGLAWIHFKEEIQSPIAKFLTQDELDAIRESCQVQPGDSVLIIAHLNKDIALQAMGRLRLDVAQEIAIPKTAESWLWVTDFPLFSQDAQSGDLTSVHHPFTAPHPDDLDDLAGATERLVVGESVEALDHLGA